MGNLFPKNELLSFLCATVEVPLHLPPRAGAVHYLGCLRLGEEEWDTREEQVASKASKTSLM